MLEQSPGSWGREQELGQRVGAGAEPWELGQSVGAGAEPWVLGQSPGSWSRALGARAERGSLSPREPHSAYMARMLFSGSRGISRTLVLDRMASWLVVETVFPVIRWTW